MGNFTFIPEKTIQKSHKCDTAFVLIVFLLWSLGLLTLWFSSSYFAQRVYDNSLHFVKRQLISSCIGLIAFVFFASIKPSVLKKMLPVLTLGSIVLCLMVFLPYIGIERNGAKRWLRIPFLSTFQPSESIKFIEVLFLANYFDRPKNNSSTMDNPIAPALIGLMTFVSVIFLQQDFSTGLFVLGIGIILFFVCGVKLAWLIPSSILGVPMAFLMILLKPYRVNRLIGFFDPGAYQQTYNYQSIAAKKAISAGGYFGQGMGSGLSKIKAIPEIQSDYIFAGWTEANGFIGVCIFVFLLVLFAILGYRIALTCEDKFCSVASFGFTTEVVLQSIVNIAVVGGVVPSTGIPLPFFSSGGSSIIFTMAMCGFIVNASRNCILESNHKKIGEGIYE